MPHISRMLVGADHQKLLPTSMLVGAIYLIIVDDLARTLTASEIPISILTVLLGAPLFAVLVYRLRRGLRNE
ncbi:iron chelate uptake ABC transporter family permease subunit [Spirabiliibacterium pneumoniae]|uniref:iron chelate uptake ABC transporter family permease subunit n=1 Tax=Spirabiliibacterium pneumoniae TaxID=221400 RepID=UPI002E2BFB0D|nr:iron chelate uptake ABC transporter family permease subunit [Spirabiliibacterium pneumoniae]